MTKEQKIVYPKVWIHIEHISLCECIFRSPAVRDIVPELGN